ncbi:MAG: CBS domain-containing protein [Peptococcaceae bacterium]|jgi:CBS domain-containing protein|nr:CBS domain-containing protein [Peptococcaceae bacterium]
MEFNERQKRIAEIVRNDGPITGESIAACLNLNKATLRPDLTILTMSGVLEARPRVGYTYRENNEFSQLAKRLRQLRVGDFMSISVAVCEESSIYDAIVTLFTHDAGGLAVIDRDRVLMGMLSRKDLLKAALGQNDLQQIPVSVIMTRMPNIIVTTPDETVHEAARKIVQHEIDTLPVVEGFVDEDGSGKYEIVGRFTKTTVTKIFTEIAEVDERMIVLNEMK